MNMICAYCGKSKNYQKDFPISYYAKCKDCFKKIKKTKQ